MEDNKAEKVKTLLLFFEVAQKSFEVLDLVRGDIDVKLHGEEGMRALHKKALVELRKDDVDLVKVDALLLNMEVQATVNSMTSNSKDLDFTNGGYTGEGYPDARKEHVINKP